MDAHKYNSAIDTQQSTAGTPDVLLLSSPSRQPVELKGKKDASTILDKFPTIATKGTTPGEVADTQPEEGKEEGSKSLAGSLNEEPTAATAGSPADEIADVQSKEEGEGGQSLAGIVDEDPNAATEGIPPVPAAQPQAMVKKGKSAKVGAKVGKKQENEHRPSIPVSSRILRSGS